MKKLICLLLAAVLLMTMTAVSATAENGTAEFAFQGQTYRVTYEKSVITDGKLNVVISGFGSVLKIINNEIVLAAWASAEVGGREIQAATVNVSGQGVYTYIFETDLMPDRVLLYPHEDSKNAVVLWVNDGSTPAPEPEKEPEPDTLPFTDGSRTYSLSIGKYGFTDEGKTTYGVTVNGYTREGGADPTPFRVAVAWSPEQYLTASVYGQDTGSSITAYFMVPEDVPEEEPKYIIIAARDREIPWGDYYVIDEGKFHPGTEFAGEEPTPAPTPEPTATPEPTPEPTPSPVPQAETELLKQPGQYVTFGRYPQEDKGTDMTPVEWLVLEYDESGRRALLISRYILDAERYNAKPEPVTWEECSLRTWLNGYFLNTAFSPEEQQAILVTEVDNTETQKGKVIENHTQDRIFILSEAEIQPDGVFATVGLKKQLTSATDYGDASGATYLSSNPSTEERRASVDWWLRKNAGKDCKGAGAYWYEQLEPHWVHSYEGVRPVLWVNVDSDAFREGAKTVTEETEPPAREPADARTHPEALKTAGEYVTFGVYPQTAEGTDQTPVQWLVLDYDGENNRALLISRYGLDAKQYHTKQSKVTWEKCSLRKWLNKEFLESVFTPEEQEAISITEVDNGPDQQGYATATIKKGGKKTKDKVFLLSYAEAGAFFPGHQLRQCAVTDYAMAKRARTDDVHQTEGRPTGEWLLRSPGSDLTGVVVVGKAGHFSALWVDAGMGVIRPVIWVDLNAEYFN